MKQLLLKNLKNTKVYRGEAGWTFIETIIVIAIVLILTSTVGIIASRSVDKARQVSAKSQIETYAVALETYYLDCARYPSEEQGLLSLRFKPDIDPVPENWMGPYINKEISPDPWGRDYLYQCPGEENLPYGISSYGADGMEGGEGYDKDITSWGN